MSVRNSEESLVESDGQSVQARKKLNVSFAQDHLSISVQEAPSEINAKALRIKATAATTKGEQDSKMNGKEAIGAEEDFVEQK